MEQTCVKQAANKENCPCPRTACENHGICCACIANHRKRGKPVSCMAALNKIKKGLI